MKINDVAKKYNITCSTLRYYESEHLIDKVSKDKNGQRIYSEENEKQIEFVCCLRKAGVSIDTIKEYMLLYKQGDNTKEARLELLINEKKKLDNQIKLLKETSDRLKNKIKYYQEGGN